MPVGDRPVNAPRRERRHDSPWAGLAIAAEGGRARDVTADRAWNDADLVKLKVGIPAWPTHADPPVLAELEHTAPCGSRSS